MISLCAAEEYTPAGHVVGPGKRDERRANVTATKSMFITAHTSGCFLFVLYLPFPSMFSLLLYLTACPPERGVINTGDWHAWPASPLRV